MPRRGDNIRKRTDVGGKVDIRRYLLMAKGGICPSMENLMVK